MRRKRLEEMPDMKSDLSSIPVGMMENVDGAAGVLGCFVVAISWGVSFLLL